MGNSYSNKVVRDIRALDLAGRIQQAGKMVDVKGIEQYSETEIIRRILRGESALFEILIRRNNPYLHKTGMSYGFSHEDTQDIMQETYINAYMNLAKFQNRSSFKTWLIKIMLNNCFHKREKFSYKNEIISDKAVMEKSTPMYAGNNNSDPDRSVVNRELSHVIERSLKRIPLDYRMVFSLREMSGLNIAETAETLNITESNVKVRLNRAKAMLRKEVEKTYSAEEIFEFNLIYCDAMVQKVMHRIGDLS